MTPTPSPDTLTTLREKVEQAIDAIEELDGPMPYEARLIAFLDPAESLRAAVRATKSEAKRAVLALLSSLPPSPDGEPLTADAPSQVKHAAPGEETPR